MYQVPMNIRVTMALVIALAVGVPAHAAQRLFGADGAGGNPATNLYVLNPTNGAIISTIGPIGFAITGLAFDPSTGVLYGSTGNASPTSPRSLVRIDTATGAGTLIGSFGVSTQTMADLTFFGGTLYGSGSSRGALYTVNVATGLATLVGLSGRTSFAFGNALAANRAGNFFAAAGDGSSLELFSVNPSTGLQTLIGTITGAPAPTQAITALAFDASNTLFGANAGNDNQSAFLLTIDPTTGAAVNLGQTVDGLDAIAFQSARPAPALGEWGQILMAGLLVAGGVWTMRRRRASR
jgi:hypothetical protein